MKNRRFKFTFIIILLFSIIALSANIYAAAINIDAAAKVTLSATKDGGGVFYPNQSVNDLLAAAKTNGIALQFDSKSSTYATSDGSFSVAVSGETVKEIYNSRFDTADGLVIGNGVDTITKIYGKPISYIINDAQMYLYDIDGVYMEVLSTNLNGPDAIRPPVVAEIRYLSSENPILTDFHGIYKEDTDTSAPLGNGTGMINNGQYLYFVYTDYANGFNISPLYRMNKKTGEKELLSRYCNSGIYIYARRLYYTASDSSGNPIVCNMALDGTDVQTLFNGSLSYQNDNNGKIYFTVQEGDKIKLMQADMQGQNSSLINSDISNFISGSVYGGVLYDAVNDGTLALHYIDPLTSKDAIIATFPAVDGDTNYTIIENAEVFRGNVYYTVGSRQGSGSYWYGDLYRSNIDGSSTKRLMKNTAENFYIYGKNLYYMQDQYKNTEKNMAIDLFSEQTIPANQSVFDVYDHDRSVYFDNSSKTKLILASKVFDADSSGVKNVISLDRLANPDVTQSIGRIFTSGNWIYFQVKNVDYSDMSYGWRGNTLPSQFYIVKKDGTGLRLLNAQKDRDDATFDTKPIYADPAKINAMYNGEKINLVNKPFIEDGVVYVPLREILNLCGVADENISWYEGTVTIVVLPTIAEVYTYVSSDDYCYINDMAVRLLGKAILKDNKTYVSVDFLKIFEICQADLGGRSIINNLKIFYNNNDLIEESKTFATSPDDITLDADGLDDNIIYAYKNKIIQMYELNNAYNAYFLYDMDCDNIKELFIGYRSMFVYTYKNGSIHKLGAIYNDTYKLVGEAGIYTYGGFGTGLGGTLYYEIQNDRLVTTEGKVNLEYVYISDDVVYRYNGKIISEEDYNNIVTNNFNESNLLGENKNNVND